MSVLRQIFHDFMHRHLPFEAAMYKQQAVCIFGFFNEPRLLDLIDCAVKSIVEIRPTVFSGSIEQNRFRFPRFPQLFVGGFVVLSQLATGKHASRNILLLSSLPGFSNNPPFGAFRVSDSDSRMSSTSSSGLRRSGPTSVVTVSSDSESADGSASSSKDSSPSSFTVLVDALLEESA